MTHIARNVIAGAVAGAVGTLAMDLVWWGRHRAGGGDQPFTEWDVATTDSFDDAGAPAQVAQKVTDAVGVDLPDDEAGTTTNVMHWLTGVGYGIGHGLLRDGRGTVAAGLATGVGAFATSYATLGAAGFYEPIWEYDPETLYKDLSAHLAFGMATSAAFALLSGSDDDE